MKVFILMICPSKFYMPHSRITKSIAEMKLKHYVKLTVGETFVRYLYGAKNLTMLNNYKYC